MKVVRYEPWSLIDRMHRDIDRLFAGTTANEATAEEAVADWVPAVDIAEFEDRFVVRADIPGVDRDAIEITMDEGVLTLRGERATNEEAEFRRVERARGRFFRRFNLPDAADAEGITARHANGVLEIAIPKQAKVMPRKIAVEAA